MMSAWLIGKIAADEAACAFRRWRTHPRPAADWTRIASEVAAAAALHEAQGWCADPAAYHRPPPPPREVHSTAARAAGVDFEHVQFDSGYAPPADEPGAARWKQYAPCATAHAWLLRRDSPRRPWLVCIPGYGMGMPLLDLGSFAASRLAAELDVNVVLPVLPLHGPRRIGRMSGDGYFAGDCLDTLHAQAQAVWDIRRLIAWIRAQGGRTIGAYGLSLGGYTAALLAALEPRLACVVAGIPAADFVHLAQIHTPAAILAPALELGLDWATVERALRVVSPLAMPPRVPWARRYLFAGTADRIVPLAQPRRLWRHWQRPQAIWYRGTHLSFAWESRLHAWLGAALRSHLDVPAVPARPVLGRSAASRHAA
jgi:hypothetical protein